MAEETVGFNPLKCQSHKMVKHTQTICQQMPMNCLSKFDHLVKLALKGLTYFECHLFFA